MLEMRGGKKTQPQKFMEAKAAKGAFSPKQRVVYLGMSRSMKRHCWDTKSTKVMKATTRQKLPNRSSSIVVMASFLRSVLSSAFLAAGALFPLSG